MQGSFGVSVHMIAEFHKERKNRHSVRRQLFPPFSPVANTKATLLPGLGATPESISAQQFWQPLELMSQHKWWNKLLCWARAQPETQV